MSGGHFDYRQLHIRRIMEDVEKIIRDNDSTELDEWDSRIGYGYTPETIEKFQEAVVTLKRAAIMAQRIDWLLSGDDGEESFHERWDEELKGEE
jgi:nicotinic acid mononucleotide adenylyltransferase